MTTYTKQFKLKQWEEYFNNKIHPPDHQVNFYDEFKEWIKMNDFNKEDFDKFYENVKLVKGYNGQYFLRYTETNGRVIEIRPIFRYYPIISLEQLYDYAKKKSLEFWDREFTGKIELSKRYYTTCNGLYYPYQETIRMSEHMNAVYPNEYTYDTLLHELIHWHLHTSGQPFNDSDYEFFIECKKRNVGLAEGLKWDILYNKYEKRMEAEMNERIIGIC